MKGKDSMKAKEDCLRGGLDSGEDLIQPPNPGSYAYNDVRIVAGCRLTSTTTGMVTAWGAWTDTWTRSPSSSILLAKS